MSQPSLFDPVIDVVQATANTLGHTRTGDPSTSFRAAADNLPRSGSQKARILVALLAGPATPNELDHHIGWRLTTAGRRTPELEAMGLIAFTGTERPTDTRSDARVVALTERGRIAAEALA